MITAEQAFQSMLERLRLSSWRASLITRASLLYSYQWFPFPSLKENHIAHCLKKDIGDDAKAMVWLPWSCMSDDMLPWPLLVGGFASFFGSWSSMGPLELPDRKWYSGLGRYSKLVLPMLMDHPACFMFLSGGQGSKYSPPRDPMGVACSSQSNRAWLK